MHISEGLSACKRYAEKVKILLGLDSVVFDISQDTGCGVACTYLLPGKVTQIKINLLHPMFTTKNEALNIRNMFGVIVHEMLHKLYTDPMVEEKALKRTRIPFQNLFHKVNNILEDFIIESRCILTLDVSDDVIDILKQGKNGVDLHLFNPVRCLDSAILTSWKMSPPVSEMLPEHSQIISAMIQFTDMGPLVPGSRVKEPLKEDIAEIYGELMQAVFESPEERIKRTVRIYNIIEKYCNSDTEQNPGGTKGQNREAKRTLTKEEIERLKNAPRNSAQAKILERVKKASQNPENKPSGSDQAGKNEQNSSSNQAQGSSGTNSKASDSSEKPTGNADSNGGSGSDNSDASSSKSEAASGSNAAHPGENDNNSEHDNESSASSKASSATDNPADDSSSDSGKEDAGDASESGNDTKQSNELDNSSTEGDNSEQSSESKADTKDSSVCDDNQDGDSFADSGKENPRDAADQGENEQETPGENGADDASETGNDTKQSNESDSSDGQESANEETAEGDPYLGKPDDYKSIDKRIEEIIRERIPVEEIDKLTGLVKDTRQNTESVNTILDKNYSGQTQTIVCKNYTVTGVSESTELAYKQVIEANREFVTRFSKKLTNIAQEEDARDVSMSGRISTNRDLKHKDTSLRVFEKRNVFERTDSRVIICLDCSGSMVGTKIMNAKNALCCIVEGLTRAGIPVKVMTFCEQSRTVVHHHYVGYKNTLAAKSSIMMIEAGGCNFDGYSIDFARKDLLKLKSQHHLMIVISDGKPSSNLVYDKIADTARAVREAKRKTRVIGIGVDANKDVLRGFYKDTFIELSSIEQLMTSLGKLILKEVRKWE